MPRWPLVFPVLISSQMIMTNKFCGFLPLVTKFVNIRVLKHILQKNTKEWTSHYRHNSTIFALSSGVGKSGVAVFRISGRETNHLMNKMVKFEVPPVPRMAYLKTIFDPETQEPLDKGLLLWFPGPKSFTGEDMCELQVHGSKAVIQAITQALSKLPDFRPAEPGEFTKRAFYAGKFDLTEVEGLSDLIDAETEMQRKQALHQMEGSLREIYYNWRKIIVENLAFVEAFIDFSEDDNIEDNVLLTVEKNLRNLRVSIQEHLNDSRKGEILRDGIKTVIVGSPNVGKSSLLNLLCKRPAAIVTEIAGTTRDVIQSTLNINGYPVLLSDTAGIRKEGIENIVEKEGIRRSMEEATAADLILLVLDVRDFFSNLTDISDFNIPNIIRSYCDNYQKQLEIDSLVYNRKLIIVANKWDLLGTEEQNLLKKYFNTLENVIAVSCRTEEGISKMLEYMSFYFQQLCGQPDRKNPACSRARHRYHLKECIRSLDQYLEQMDTKNPETQVVVAAEMLRDAVWHLGMITGIVRTDEVLTVIFKQFCIGK